MPSRASSVVPAPQSYGLPKADGIAKGQLQAALRDLFGGSHCRFLIVTERRPRRVEISAELGVDGIHGLRSVVGDGGDVAIAFVQDGAGHALAPSRSGG